MDGWKDSWMDNVCRWDLSENMTNPCWALGKFGIFPPLFFPLHLFSISCQNLCIERWQKACCLQSDTPTLILKRWKSCCLPLSSLFVSPQRLFTSHASPSSSPSSPSLGSFPPFLCSADTKFYCLLPKCCQGKQVPYLWGLFLHVHLCLCIIMFSF